jgi:DNA polymerase-3 subunit chi
MARSDGAAVSDAGGAAPTTVVRFYTLNDGSGTARFRHACALAEQAYLAGERLLVWLQDPPAQSAFDDLLWTFGDRAFVPHEPLAADPASCEAPVQLHSGASLDDKALRAGFTTLLLLREEPREEALRFPTVIEVVDAEPACRNAGRARFRFYRERGSTPQHIEVTP